MQVNLFKYDKLYLWWGTGSEGFTPSPDQVQIEGCNKWHDYLVFGAACPSMEISMRQ